MAKRAINIYLDDDTIEELDIIARHRKKARSELIREFIVLCLNQEKYQEILGKEIKRSNRAP